MDIKVILDKQSRKKKLTYDEISFVVRSYVCGNIDDKLMSRYIRHLYKHGMSEEELNYLTKVMVESGEVMDLSSLGSSTVDKHSSGGIGDKVTLIVSPIVASCGVIVPKMSGRGLGITGGTADKLESIPGYKLNLTKEEFIKQLKDIKVSVISQSENMAVADKRIYALRNEIKAVDSIPLIASSIMSKKIASGSKNIVMDIKVGTGAFMKNKSDAIKLAKTMIKIGKSYDRKVVCTLSDMSTPLGLYIGNSLEVMEVINYFNGKHDKRLYDLTVYLSSLMISVSKGISLKSAKREVLISLENGYAKNKFYEWIKYQGGKIEDFRIDAKKYIVMSKKDGYISEIKADVLGKLVFDLGAGRIKKTDSIDYSVGVVLNKTISAKVRKGEILGIIYYNKDIFDKEETFLSAFSITKTKRRIKDIIIKTIE